MPNRERLTDGDGRAQDGGVVEPQAQGLQDAPRRRGPRPGVTEFRLLQVLRALHEEGSSAFAEAIELAEDLERMLGRDVSFPVVRRMLTDLDRRAIVDVLYESRRSADGERRPGRPVHFYRLSPQAWLAGFGAVEDAQLPPLGSPLRGMRAVQADAALSEDWEGFG